MTKSFWFGDAYQKGNFSNGKQDTFNPNKRYIGIRLQQGVPLLDRDWNELEDIRRNEEQMLRSWYIGDGIPGDTGFKIMPPDKQGDDFKINNGRCMVDGFLVINDSDILYSAQTEGEADADKISEMKTFFVYLDVWIEEVNGEGDPALKNDKDVKMETCVRHQLKWRVRVRSGKLVSKKNHHYYDLAKVERGQTGSIEETNISDLRRTGLSLSRLREGLFVDKSGNVGIGTDKPSRPLHVEGEIHSSRGFCFADWKQTFVETPSKGERWAWYANNGIARLWSGGDKLSVTHDGKVGIGTTDPQAKLDVRGDICLGSPNEGKLLLTYQSHTHFIRANKWWTEFVSHPNEGWKFISNDGKTENERVRITSSGNVGIGTDEPKATLDVRGDIRSSGNFEGTIRMNNTSEVDSKPSEFNREVSFDIKRGRVIGLDTHDEEFSGTITLSPSGPDGKGASHHQLNFNSGGIFYRKTGMRIYATPFKHEWGSWIRIQTESNSDERFKAEIMPLTHVLDKLENIRGISFEWNKLYESLGYPKNGGGREIGLIAQEVEAVFPELVTSQGEEKYRVLDYERMTAVLVEAVKELRAEVEALRRKVTS